MDPAHQLDPKTKKAMLSLQRNELTESEVYFRLAKRTKNPENANILERIGNDEITHAKIWQMYTGQEARPRRWKVFFYSLAGLLLGFTFTVRRMEIGEEKAQIKYADMYKAYPETQSIIADEKRHEDYLIGMLDEERLKYVGSMVLGLNDALVELTGTLAGLTFALQNNRLVALSGIITGVAATFSMAASEYLSARSDGRKDALKSCIYTGIAYLITVVLLVLPYLLLPAGAYWVSLVILVLTVVLIIFLFNFYISVAKGTPFLRRFVEMIVISMGTALFSFLVGLLAKQFLGLDVG